MNNDAPTLLEIIQLTRQELTHTQKTDPIRECGRAALAAIGGIGTLVVVALWMKLFPHLRRRQKLENEVDPVQD